jgi:hypothetical protein
MTKQLFTVDSIVPCIISQGGNRNGEMLGHQSKLRGTSQSFRGLGRKWGLATVFSAYSSQPKPHRKAINTWFHKCFIQTKGFKAFRNAILA